MTAPSTSTIEDLSEASPLHNEELYLDDSQKKQKELKAFLAHLKEVFARGDNEEAIALFCEYYADPKYKSLLNALNEENPDQLFPAHSNFQEVPTFVMGISTFTVSQLAMWGAKGMLVTFAIAACTYLACATVLFELLSISDDFIVKPTRGIASMTGLLAGGGAASYIMFGLIGMSAASGVGIPFSIILSAVLLIAVSCARFVRNAYDDHVAATPLTKQEKSTIQTNGQDPDAVEKLEQAAAKLGTPNIFSDNYRLKLDLLAKAAEIREAGQPAQPIKVSL